MGGTSTGASLRPRRRPNSTAAAVVDVACADGKLSRLGVPTSTCTRGSVGRGRRTTRLTAIDAPCATATPAVAVTQSRRRARSTSAPSRPSASQPAACSPNSDMPRAVATTGPVPIRRCTAASARTSVGATGSSTVSVDDAGAAGAGAVPAKTVFTATGGISRCRWGGWAGCRPTMLRGVTDHSSGRCAHRGSQQH